MHENELMHFGVLGMKWGIRRYQPYSVKPRGSGKGGKEIIKETKRKVKEGKETIKKRVQEVRESDPDYEIKKERAEMSKKRRHLSDEDIKKAIKRLEQEKRLKQLTEEDVHTGKVIAKTLYSDYGKKAVTVFTTAATVAAGMAIAKKMGIDEHRVMELAKAVAKVKGK